MKQGTYLIKSDLSQGFILYFIIEYDGHCIHRTNSEYFFNMLFNDIKPKFKYNYFKDELKELLESIQKDMIIEFYSPEFDLTLTDFQNSLPELFL